MNRSVSREEVKNAILKNLENEFEDFKQDLNWSFKKIFSDEFCLRSDREFILGKIYYEPLSSAQREQLKSELMILQKQTGESVRLCVIFPEMKPDLYPKDNLAHYFHYHWVQKESESLLKLRRLADECEIENIAAIRDIPPPKSETYTESPGQLNREEILELMDLSLDMKRTGSFCP